MQESLSEYTIQHGSENHHRCGCDRETGKPELDPPTSHFAPSQEDASSPSEHTSLTISGLLRRRSLPQRARLARPRHHPRPQQTIRPSLGHQRRRTHRRRPQRRLLPHQSLRRLSRHLRRNRFLGQPQRPCCPSRSPEIRPSHQCRRLRRRGSTRS